DRAMLELLDACGLRVTELATIRLENLHLADGFVLVRGKGSKERIVPIADVSAAWVARHVAARPPGSGSWVFPGSRGKAVTRQTVFNALKAAARKAGLPASTVSPHVLQHAFATHLVANSA